MEKKETMYIDGHPLEKEELLLARAGKMEESLKKKLEFLEKVKSSGIDHCPCTEKCRHHGNCYECVILHRGHQDHVPVCFFPMINAKLTPLYYLTECTLGGKTETKQPEK